MNLIAKTYETVFELGAKIDSSFNKAFSNAQKQLRLTEKQTTQSNARLKALNKVVSMPTIKVRDMTGNAIGSVKSRLLSLQNVAAIALTTIGVNKLGEATLGAAMDFEQYTVSMEHWLNGNKKVAKEYSSWLNSYANRTPFEMTDIFPAGSRAVNVSDGDVKKAERLVVLAGNMAALTPGKTMEMAMEALADVKVGEYARLQEFGYKWKKELGSYEDFMLQAEKKFADGADKLSRTARGRISTITDVIKTQFRSAGEGMLTAMSPRLQKITAWFDNHPKTVARWRTELIKLGNQAGEAVFLRMEKAFRYVQKNYIDNPKFTKLTFSGKVAFIAKDSLEGLQKWLDGEGGTLISSVMYKMGELSFATLNALLPKLEPIITTLGRALGRGILSGMKGAVKQGMKENSSGAALSVFKASTMGTALPFRIWDMAQNLDNWFGNNEKGAPKKTPIIGLQAAQNASKSVASQMGGNGGVLSVSALDSMMKNAGDHSNNRFSLTNHITVQGNGDAKEIKSVVDASNKDFEKRMKKYVDGKTRLKYTKK